MARHLPPELLAQILDFVDSDPAPPTWPEHAFRHTRVLASSTSQYDYISPFIPSTKVLRENHASIANMSRVCRTWRQETLPRLFRVMTLSCRDNGTDTFYQALVNNSTDALTLAPLIRVCAITMLGTRPGSADGELVDIDEGFKGRLEAVSKMPHLHSLCLSDHHVLPTELMSVISSLPELAAVHFGPSNVKQSFHWDPSSDTPPPAHIAAFCTRMSSLTRLSLDSLDVFQSLTSAPITLLSDSMRITSFRVRYISKRDASLLSRFLTHHSTMTELVLGIPNGEFLRGARPPFTLTSPSTALPNLSHLTCSAGWLKVLCPGRPIRHVQILGTANGYRYPTDVMPSLGGIAGHLEHLVAHHDLLFAPWPESLQRLQRLSVSVHLVSSSTREQYDQAVNKVLEHAGSVLVDDIQPFMTIQHLDMAPSYPEDLVDMEPNWIERTGRLFPALRLATFSDKGIWRRDGVGANEGKGWRCTSTI